MPKSGKPLSVRMTNCGPLGWMTDEHGYRYQPTHPETGEPWPPIPDILLQGLGRAWRLSPSARKPAWSISTGRPPAWACIRIATRQDMAAPVVSLSLGDSCLFRIGGTKRTDPTRSLRLASGDAVVLGGRRAARLSRRRPDHARHLDAAARKAGGSI